MLAFNDYWLLTDIMFHKFNDCGLLTDIMLFFLKVDLFKMLMYYNIMFFFVLTQEYVCQTVSRGHLCLIEIDLLTYVVI